MSRVPTQDGLHLPDSLQQQLLTFRRRLWTIKLVESVCGAALAVLLAFLTVFVLDRMFDTPAGLRTVILSVALLGCALVPWAAYRWVWRHRRLEQLARLLSLKHPSIGDQLLGIIELVQSESEQARSLALCNAAVQQVAEAALKRDFSDSVPNPKHRRRAFQVQFAVVILIGLLAVAPAAVSNAWARFLMPWKSTPRYTFAAIEPLPERLVVAHGEPFTISVALAETTDWRPGDGTVQLEGQQPLRTSLESGRYEFSLPALISPASVRIRIGDHSTRLHVEPTLRPELVSLMATVGLPQYLGIQQPLRKDVRGGTVSLVKGSRATFEATANRELSAAKIDGQSQKPVGSKVTSPAAILSESRQLEFQWRDHFGLTGKEPFTISIHGREDEAPSLACENLPRQKVVLDSETLTFKIKAQDDFGIKRVGIEWIGIDKSGLQKPAKGERILAAGGNAKDVLELVGTFSAKSLEIDPQPIEFRMFTEDYFPDRERVYSSAYVLYVLNAEQHAIWLTEMLNRWHRQSLEVRDREMQLFETNKQLRELSSQEIDLPETRRKIENQANAERANGRRLAGLVTSGEELVRQATRNPEFGVGHLEKWAEMLQILQDIAGNRMPSVADLLKEASQSQVAALSAPSPEKAPMAGQVRASVPGSPQEGKAEAKKSAPPVPSIVDVESTQLSLKPSPADPAEEGKKGSPSLGLPTTSLLGGGGESESCPASQKVEEAVVKQQDLLAEFEKISDELNRILANLEGSTLVKRLKSASRTQYKIAGRLSDLLTGPAQPEAAKSVAAKPEMNELATQEAKSSTDVSTIMDDMQSYFERRRFMQFKTVLDEMRKEDVIGSLRQIGDDLNKEHGLSIAQCEFWSDTLDRWAEDLVDPASGGT